MMMTMLCLRCNARWYESAGRWPKSCPYCGRDAIRPVTQTA